MDDRDINNVHAWRMLQRGKASPDDQKLAFEIHKAIASEEKGKQFSVTTSRNLLLDMLIYRENIPKSKAYKVVEAVEHVSDDTARKDYNAWEQQAPEERKIETERYFRAQSNFEGQEKGDAKAARIQAAIKEMMGE